jgi:hypothetical protein
MQRGSLKAAAAALAAPTEAECGLTVDTDVAEEQQRQRQRCASYLRQRTGADGALPAEAVLLPAQAAMVLPAKGGSGDELALTRQPYAVEMFGLRKVYKVSVATNELKSPQYCLPLPPPRLSYPTTALFA